MGYTSSACTDEPCQWNQCFVKKLEAAPVSKIKFYKQEAKDKVLKARRKKVNNITCSRERQRALFVQTLADDDDQLLAISTYTDYCQVVDSRDITASVHLPNSLRTLHSELYANMSESDLKDLCKTWTLPTISPEKLDYVEEVTHAQSSSLVWHEQRAGRITASTAHLAMKARDKPTLLVSKICKPQLTPINAPAVIWGRRHEDVAFRLYKEAMTEGTCSSMKVSKQHVLCTTKKSGLHISRTLTYLAASPDGIVDCKCCGQGVMEIKCPYKHKDSPIVEAVQDQHFCLDPEMNIKKDHHYFTQVQMQMFVCNTTYADLLLWTMYKVLETQT